MTAINGPRRETTISYFYVRYYPTNAIPTFDITGAVNTLPIAPFKWKNKNESRPVAYVNTPGLRKRVHSVSLSREVVLQGDHRRDVRSVFRNFVFQNDRTLVRSRGGGGGRDGRRRDTNVSNFTVNE